MRGVWIGAAATILAGLIPVVINAFDFDPERPGASKSVKTKGAEARFAHYGDVLEVRDTKADGYGVTAYLLVDGKKFDVHAFGNGETQSQNYDFPEGSYVWVGICYTHGRDVIRCTEPQMAVA